MQASVLMVEQEVDRRGVCYKSLLSLDGRFVTCFIRSQLERSEVLERLARIHSLSDIYSIDQKAVLIEP